MQNQYFISQKIRRKVQQTKVYHFENALEKRCAFEKDYLYRNF